MSERFPKSRVAKEYLVERIVAQARQDAIELSEIERKMLYFTETSWTLPDMPEVSTRFDQEYDQDEYERKIAQVVRRIHETARESDEESWGEAVAVLSSEDHYLLVLINPRLTRGRGARPSGDIAKLILTAALIIAALMIGFWIFAKYQGK